VVNWASQSRASNVCMGLPLTPEKILDALEEKNKE